MNIITIPSINHNGSELKPVRSFDIGTWNQKLPDIDNFGFEAEGFVIDTDGIPLAFSSNRFHHIPVEGKEIDKISQYASGEDELNSFATRKGKVFADKIARITQELYMPSIEISLNKGYAPADLLEIVLLSFDGLDKLANSNGGFFLPIGNLPESTPNVPNYANEYYRYLFEERDGHDIADFRGAGLQLHKGIEDKNMAIYIFNKIRHLLPFFLSISGNSPIHQGRYRGNISERTSTKSAWKMVGIPDAIDESFYAQLQEWINTTIKSVTPYYYAVRYPRVDIRTIENCSMDMVHDIGIMVTLMDIYYRITEKLRQHYLSGEHLPIEIFGTDTGCMVETNVIRENFHRAIRKGTHTNFAGIGRKQEIDFIGQTSDLLNWINEIPSIFPSYISTPLGIPKNIDATGYVLSEIGRLGNLGERTIQDLGLSKNIQGGRSQDIPTSEIRKYTLSVATNFRNQLHSIIIP